MLLRAEGIVYIHLQHNAGQRQAYQKLLVAKFAIMNGTLQLPKWLSDSHPKAAKVTNGDSSVSEHGCSVSQRPNFQLLTLSALNSQLVTINYKSCDA